MKAFLVVASLALNLAVSGCGPADYGDRSSKFSRFESHGERGSIEGASDSSPTRQIPGNGSVYIASAPRLFERCGNVRIDCVVDGDTLWLNGTKVRVADIDTPEISEPKCPSELALGEKATRRFIELLNEGEFQVITVGRDVDRYGRKLRLLVRGGRSLGDQLVSEGLARKWTGRRQPWC